MSFPRGPATPVCPTSVSRDENFHDIQTQRRKTVTGKSGQDGHPVSSHVQKSKRTELITDWSRDKLPIVTGELQTIPGSSLEP